jgi:hypothetical protein
VVNCSGVFRDLFINQMALLDRAVKMAAEADEPLEMNFVRKHALEQAEEMGLSVRQAATRIFSNASGSYAANVNLAVENSTWEERIRTAGDVPEAQVLRLQLRQPRGNGQQPGPVRVLPEDGRCHLPKPGFLGDFPDRCLPLLRL